MKDGASGIYTWDGLKVGEAGKGAGKGGCLQPRCSNEEKTDVGTEE